MGFEDVAVALTTSRHTLLHGLESFMGDDLINSDVPICVVESSIGMAGSDVEHMEHLLSRVILNSSKLVHVDVDKKYVYVGEDPSVPDSGTVEYYETGAGGQMALDFFARWKETQSMVFEFQMDGVSIPDLKPSGLRFTIVGFWTKGKWSILEMSPDRRFYVTAGKRSVNGRQTS